MRFIHPAANSNEKKKKKKVISKLSIQVKDEDFSFTFGFQALNFTLRFHFYSVTAVVLHIL